MHHVSFGDVLKEARLARGLDLATVSRNLRIRQDIIVAIENGDFSRMPSRGYARNMIIAYARLVGLDPQEVSRMYLDQEYAHQIEQAHRNVGNSVQMHRDTATVGRSSRGTSSFDRVGSSRRSSSERTGSGRPYDGSSNGMGRRVYSQDSDVRPTAFNPPVAHRARRSAMTEGKYTNLYTQPSNIPNPNRRRTTIIAVAVGVVLVVVLVLALFLSHRDEPQATIPVTGATATSQQDDQGSADTASADTQTTTEQPPTEFTVSYSVADGSEAYIEVYVDGKTKEADDVAGPAQQSYTSSDTIRFVTTETKGVTLTVDGEEVKLSANDNGIVNLTYTFSDILDQWYEDHPDVKRTDDADDSSGGSSSGGSSSGGSSSKSSGSNS